MSLYKIEEKLTANTSSVFLNDGVKLSFVNVTCILHMQLEPRKNM